MYHILFVHLSVNGHLGCFHFWLLWIMLLQTFMYKFLCECMFSFLLGVYLRVELLDHLITLCLITWRIGRLFSKAVTPFYLPTSSVWEFQFLHILTSTCYYLCFWLNPSWEMWSVMSLWFWFAFPWWVRILSIFSCAYWTSIYLLWRNVCLDPLPIFRLSCLFIIEL